MSLSSLIVQREVASMRQVEEAIARQVLYGGDLVTNLLEVAAVDEGRLSEVAAEASGLEPAPAGVLPSPDERARSSIPPDLAAKRSLYPLAFTDDESLVVAVAEPLRPQEEEQLMFALGHPIVQRVAPLVRIRQALTREYGAPLERRHERLLQRLQGDPTAFSSSLPPLLRDVPPVVIPPQPRTFPPPTPGMVAALRSPASAAPPPASPTSPAASPGPAHTPTEPQFLAVREVVDFGSGAPRPNSSRPPPIAQRSEGSAPPTPVSPTGAPRSNDTIRPTLLRDVPAISRPSRRRRGPVTFDQARAELEEVADRDALLDLVFDFSRQYFDYAALFVVHGDVAEGRDAWGGGASRERVVSIGVPLDMPSMLLQAKDLRAPVVVKPADAGIDAVLVEELHRKAQHEVIVVPIVVRTRVVAMLYGDAGEANVDRDAVGDVTTFALLAGQTFERLIIKKKLGGFAPGAPSSRVGKVVDASQVAKKRPSSRPIDDDAAKAALTRAVSTPFPAAPAAPATSVGQATAPEDPFGDMDVGGEESAPPTDESPGATTGTFGVPSRRRAPESPAPPPPANLLVRRPSGPPIPREEPIDATARPAEHVFVKVPSRPPPPTSPIPPRPFDREEAEGEEEQAPITEQEQEQEQTDIDETTLVEVEPTPAPPPSESMIAVPARPPPPAHGAIEELPSVIVDVSRELDVLVDRYVRDPADEQAEAELLREGPQAMPAIMGHFPGPIVLAPRTDDVDVPAASHCGPVLRLIAAQRRVALPWVLEETDSREEEKRFWATFLLGDLAYADAVPSLVPRLFDASERVRRAARWAAAGVARHHGEEVARELGRIARDTTQERARRIAMLEVLEEIREPLAVPTFISVLNDESDEIASLARRALGVVTRQDFGRDPKRWTTWWNSNSSRERIEWLIDALSHEQQAVRRAAGEELKAITKEYFGYYDDLPKRDRERAQARYREWWNNEGRARFSRG